MPINLSKFESAGELAQDFLTVKVHNHGDRDAVAVAGEIDLHTGPYLRRVLSELVARGHNRLVIDLDGVTFLDSTGLGILLEARRLTKAAEGSLGLVCHAPACTRLFEISGLRQVFTFHDSVDEALLT